MFDSKILGFTLGIFRVVLEFSAEGTCKYANCKKIFNLTSLFSTPSILSTSKQKNDARRT